MSAENMREELKKLYPRSGSWQARVRAMPENQVFAIYTKFKNERKLGR